MATTQIERGVDLWCKIAQDLNQVIEELGPPIPTDHHKLWRETFYPLTDDNWFDILVTFGQFNANHGEFVKIDEYEAWLAAVEQYEQYQGVLTGDAPGYSCMNYLDRRKHKGGQSTKRKSWRMAMVLREVYCRVCGLDIPNK